MTVHGSLFKNSLEYVKVCERRKGAFLEAKASSLFVYMRSARILLLAYLYSKPFLSVAAYG